MTKLRILIAEGDAVVIMDLAAELAEGGFSVVGVAADFPHLVRMMDTLSFDVVLMAAQLGDDLTFPLARRMSAAHKPFVFVTALEVEDIPPELLHVPRIVKPFLARDAAEAVWRAVAAYQPDAA